jgi:hypothetical protein
MTIVLPMPAAAPISPGRRRQRLGQPEEDEAMPSPHPRRWHRGSIYGTGARVALDREQRARFRYLLRAHARAGRLPAKHEWVGLALLKRLGADGQLDPAQDTLAADAGCSARTVRRATVCLRSLGLARWESRLVRAGWRALQTSNAYVLLTPCLAQPVVCTGGQTGRETRKIDPIPYWQPIAAAEVAAAQAALARRRAVIDARLHERIAAAA